MHHATASGAQFFGLRQGGLIFGRHTGIADQGHGAPFAEYDRMSKRPDAYVGVVQSGLAPLDHLFFYLTQDLPQLIYLAR